MSREALDKFIESLLALRDELDYAIENDGKPRPSTAEIVADVEDAMNDVADEFGMEWFEETKSFSNKPLKH